jgi:hypothetical protein
VRPDPGVPGLLLLDPWNTAGTYVGITMIGDGVVIGLIPVTPGLVPELKMIGC